MGEEILECSGESSPVSLGRDGVELGDVVHHGRLQRDLLHEHGRGGDVLDLSLQEHLVRLRTKKNIPQISSCCSYGGAAPH